MSHDWSWQEFCDRQRQRIEQRTTRRVSRVTQELRRCAYEHGHDGLRVIRSGWTYGGVESAIKAERTYDE